MRRVGLGALLSDERNIELVRGLLASFDANFDAMKHGAPSPDLHLFDPEIEIWHVDGFPTARRYVGRESYRDWFAEGFADYTDVHWSEPAMFANGDVVVAIGELSGRVEGADPDEARLSVELALLHEIRDGLVKKIHVYLNREAALSAAGITAG
jgi:ketosteroid isomerase-like protein